MLFLLFLVVLTAKVPDSDSYFLAAAGRFIVTNRYVPKTNPFVIHEGLAMIVQQWLVDLLNYFLMEKTGLIGIMAYTAVVFYVALIMTYRYFGEFTEKKTDRIIFTFFSGVVLIQFANTRPSILTYMVLLQMLTVLERSSKDGDRKRLLWLPVLSLIEINIHASFWPALFVLMLPYIFFDSIPQKGKVKAWLVSWFHRKKGLLAAATAMLLVGFMNPNGIDGMLYFFKSYGSTGGMGSLIQEMETPSVCSLSNFGIVIGITAIGMYVSGWIRKKDTGEPVSGYSMKAVYMAAGTIVMVMMHIRNQWFMMAGIFPLALEVLEQMERKPVAHKYRYSVREYNALAVIYPMLLTVALAVCIPGVIKGEISDKVTTPTAAVEYLEQIEPDNSSLRIYTGFNNGAYLEWNGYQVYLDARPELYMSKINGKADIYTEYLTVSRVDADFEAFLRKYCFDYLVCENTENLATYLSCSEEYEEVVAGNGYKLFKRLPNVS